jgi:hypothetical protein
VSAPFILPLAATSVPSRASTINASAVYTRSAAPAGVMVGTTARAADSMSFTVVGTLVFLRFLNPVEVSLLRTMAGSMDGWDARPFGLIGRKRWDPPYRQSTTCDQLGSSPILPMFCQALSERIRDQAPVMVATFGLRARRRCRL